MPQETANFTPRFQTLANELIEKIQTGQFGPDEMLPSERELALHYDLSRQTIRNAMEILDREGWTVSHPGKGRFPMLRLQGSVSSRKPAAGRSLSTKQIGLICPSRLLFDDAEAGHPFLGLKSALSEQGYTLSLSVAAKDVKNRMHPVFPTWLKEDMMDGYILASAPPRVQERLARGPKPAVSLGYLWSDADIPSVEMDYYEINRLALHSLVEKKMLPTCNLVPIEKTVEDKRYSEESIQGYLQGVSDLGMDARQAEVLRHHNSAFELVTALRRLFKRDRPPRSLILSNGQFLLEALDYFDKKGLAVPGDVTILIIDPSNGPKECLSRVGYFNAEIFSLARRAGEKLLALIAGRDAGPRHERLVAGDFVLVNQ